MLYKIDFEVLKLKSVLVKWKLQLFDMAFGLFDYDRTKIKLKRIFDLHHCGNH